MNLTYILIKYVGNNIISEDSDIVDRELRDLFFRLALLGVSIYYSNMITLLLRLLSGSIYGRTSKWPLLFCGLVFLLIVCSYLFINYDFVKVINLVMVFLAVFIFLSEPIFFLLVFLSRKWYYKNIHKSIIRIFIIYHVGKYAFVILLWLAYLLFNLDHFLESISYLLLILFYMIPPFIWLRKFQQYLPGFGLNLGDSFLDKIALDFVLTSREKEMVEFIYNGYSNKEIEHQLSISYSTVKNHLYNIYRKMGIYSRLELSALINQHLKEQ